MSQERLGKKLRQVRELKGWSLKRTADEAKISPAYIQKLERGEVAAPSPPKLRALSSALGIAYSDLMQLAGYSSEEVDLSDADPAVGVLARALQAEDLTADELTDLASYLKFRREQRRNA